MDDGGYFCIKQPVTQDLVLAHLRGALTLGTYLLDPASQARFMIFDADDGSGFRSLISLYDSLQAETVPTFLENSRRGGHLWLFFDQPVPGKFARELGANLISRFNLPKMEIFPKQDQIHSGPGSLIRLPFGVHRRTGKRYGFVTAQLEPLGKSVQEQIHTITNSPRVPLDRLTRLIPVRKAGIQPTPFEIQPTPAGLTLSARIKASISVSQFVSRYVELTPDGRGLCPFHEDQVKSFAIEKNKNYWHCFAGCGGGSIIDFWMKYQDCDFTTAVRDLGALLLEPKE